MKDILVKAALSGLALVAILDQSWPWLAAVVAVCICFFATGQSGLATRIQLIFVAALSAGLGAEIVRTIYLSGQVAISARAGGMYKQVLIVSLGTVVFVLGAMIVEYLFRKLISGSDK